MDEALITALIEGAAAPETVADELHYAVDALPLLAPYFKQEWTIEQLERLEAATKLILHRNFVRGVDTVGAVQIARFQKEIGFLRKYKPYAVKCASPLGYSLFLQNPGEGFSFQRHLTHKVEVFHVLRVMPGGFVFVCDYTAWSEDYDRAGFEQWLEGRPDDRYERFRYQPAPGDVIVIDELNVVHTIVGCVVEEFATVSTDMVDRLHDQNAGRKIPEHLSRERVTSDLSQLAYPARSRVVQAGVHKGHQPSHIAPVELDGGSVRTLIDDFVRACHYRIEQHGRGPALHDAARATSVYITSGSGQVVVGHERASRAHTARGIPVSAGDLLLIAPNIPYQPVCSGKIPLEFSEHRISPDVAFAPSAEHAR